MKLIDIMRVKIFLKNDFFNINGKKYDLIVGSATSKSDMSIKGEREGKFERDKYIEDINLEAKMKKTFYGSINLNKEIFNIL